MRLDSYFTEEEFIKFINENISDDDIRMMFKNNNLEKDEDSLIVETEGEQSMNKEQKIQEFTERIEKSQAEIDELKKELEKLQKKPYKISYPDNETEVYCIDDYYGDIVRKKYDAFNEDCKHLYDTGLYFDTREEAEQFKREQTLIKKIKCWIKEQQGDDVNINKIYSLYNFEEFPYFKSRETAQACIDEFGDEIVEVFC